MTEVVQEFIDLLAFSFFQRALLAGVLLALLAGIVGVFTSIRKAAFFGDAVAHSALAGVAIGLFFSVDPLFSAAVYAVALSLLLPWLRKQTGFSFDSLLALLLPVSMGLGVIAFSLLPGYQPNLLSFLFGNLLSVTQTDMFFLLGLAAVVVILLPLLAKKLLLVSLDENQARLLGLNIPVYELVYHFLLALTVVSGVRLVGVVLINAFLIIPPLVVSLHARSLKQLFFLTPVVSLISVLGGIVLSVGFDLPTGAVIAVFAGCIFVVSVIFKKIRDRVGV
ncbi:MAG: metal ABC transporter permease [Pseudomonadales bacterium]|nr:metal ABC transporter permease [Pseudomonadales bacterium]